MDNNQICYTASNETTDLHASDSATGTNNSIYNRSDEKTKQQSVKQNLED